MGVTYLACVSSAPRHGISGSKPQQRAVENAGLEKIARVVKFGESMKTFANANATQDLPPVKAKKDWEKPVLDILELQSAQHGTHGLADGSIRHRSA
jgi:hypothetical protein